MVSEIRLYVEGGGRGHANVTIRKGFHQFFRKLVNQARSKGIRWQILPCGSRQRTFDDFQEALRTYRQALSVLLVDSEGPVPAHEPSWRHLHHQDGWTQPAGTTDDQCHLMVQAMEAWLIADPDGLRRYYGQGFNRNVLPGNPDVEQIEPAALTAALQAATRRTTKGPFRKIEHGSALLAQIDSDRVRRAAQHCDRLFTTLLQRLTED